MSDETKPVSAVNADHGEAAMLRCEDREGYWMQTYTGLQFWPLHPRPSEICIEDIAHSLANQCRYAGHVTQFYSVAQHSVLVSRIVPSEFALWGLLHDATEAYLVDLPRPVKRFSDMGTLYRSIEARLMVAVCEKFGLPTDEPVEVKHADDVLLMTEKRDLMPNSPAKWRESAEPLADQIEPWNPTRARAEFLRRAAELGVQTPKVKPPATVSEGACECPARKALAKVLAILPAINSAFWAACEEAKVSAPCPCEGLREELDAAVRDSRYTMLVADGLRDECDSLRAELGEIWGTVCPDAGPQDYKAIVEAVKELAMEWHAKQSELAASEERERVLRTALEARQKHGHATTCSKRQYLSWSCTCGYDVADSALATPEGTRP